MASVGIAGVNKPTDVKQKEADVNRKLQFYGIISAFQNGKVPSVCWDPSDGRCGSSKLTCHR